MRLFGAASQACSLLLFQLGFYGGNRREKRGGQLVGGDGEFRACGSRNQRQSPFGLFARLRARVLLEDKYRIYADLY